MGEAGRKETGRPSRSGAVARSRCALTFTPCIPPSQTIRHFSRRLYLSATIGSVDGGLVHAYESLRREFLYPTGVGMAIASGQPRTAPGGRREIGRAHVCTP